MTSASAPLPPPISTNSASGPSCCSTGATASATQLAKLGHSSCIQAGAGAKAGFSDAAYAAAGVEVLADAASVIAAADVVVKVRGPDAAELQTLGDGQTLISFFWPAQNAELLEAAAKKNLTIVAMDMVPRISRAQKMDALSSMANIAGYRAVIEAGSNFGRFFTGQVTAAVNGWFADPLGFGAFYQGGGPLSPSPITAGEAADLSTTAMDPALRDTLAGFAMAALIDRGVLAADATERGRLAQQAGQQLASTADARITLQARIGTVEAQIEVARSRNSAEETSLDILRSEIGSVDPYEAGTRLETIRSQLESLYLVTARVARLSLAEYLR